MTDLKSSQEIPSLESSNLQTKNLQTTEVSHQQDDCSTLEINKSQDVKPLDTPNLGKYISITLKKMDIPESEPEESEEEESEDDELEVTQTPSSKPLVSSPEVSVKKRRAKFEREAKKNVKELQK